MSGIGDVVVATRLLLEPTDQVDVDETGAEPIDWEAAAEGRWYVYSTTPITEVAFESGPTARQDFRLRAAFVVPTDEQALRRMDGDVTAYIDEKRASVFDAIRRNRSTVVWHHMTATEVPGPRLLTKRSLAFDLVGYRFVGA